MRDVNEVLDDIGMGKYHILQLVMLSGLFIADGAEVIIASSTVKGLQASWHLSPAEKGMMMSCIFLGVFAGNLLGGYVADAFGRRCAVCWAYFGFIVSALLSCVAQVPMQLLAARFLFGIFYGMGIGPSVTLQVETAPAAWRGQLVNSVIIFFVVGEVYASVLLVKYMPFIAELEVRDNWQAVAAIGVVPAALMFPFVLFLLQESPHWYVLHGRYAEAVGALKRIAFMSDHQSVVQDLQLQTLSHPTASASIAQAELGTNRRPARSSLLQQSGQERAGAADDCGTFWDRVVLCFSPEYRWIVFGGIYMCFLSNYLFFGLTYALGQLLNRPQGVFTPSHQVLVIALLDMPGIFITYFMISSHRFGHRDGLAVTSMISAVLLLLMVSIDHGEEYAWLAIPSAYLAKACSSILFSLVYVYLSEVFPSRCRCTALSLCMAGGRIGSAAAPMLFEELSMQEFAIGSHSMYMCISSVFCLLGVAVVRSMLIFELKNEPLEDVGISAWRACAFKAAPAAADVAVGRTSSAGTSKSRAADAGAQRTDNVQGGGRRASSGFSGAAPGG